MKWPSSKELGLGQGVFVPLKDGEPVKGLIVSEPLLFRLVWDYDSGQEKKYLPHDAAEGTFKFRVNFAMYDNESSSWHVKILEAGSSVFTQIDHLNNDKDVDLDRQMLKVTRQGTGRNTKYIVTAIPKIMDDKTRAVVGQLPLLDLNPDQDPQQAEAGSAGNDGHRVQSPGSYGPPPGTAPVADDTEDDIPW